MRFSMLWTQRIVLAVVSVVAAGGAGLSAARLEAQVSPIRRLTRFDAGAGFGSSAYVAALAVSRQYGLAATNNRLRLGYGLRYSGFGGRGSDLAFSTADPDVLDQGQRETLYIGSPFVSALNLAFFSSLRVVGPLEVGFNIDVLGFAFGPSRTAASQPTGPVPGDSPAAPTHFGLLRGGRSDHGTLNSEFYVGFWIAPRFAVRAGASHFVAEYTTESAQAFGNDRFRYTSTLAFAALSYAR